MNSSNSIRQKILLCGTQYGRTYLSAISELEYETSNVELYALIARGSDFSQRCSEQYGVPLFKAVKELPESIDLACVAIGGEDGAGIAEALIKQGTSILIEHPVAPEQLQRLLNASVQYNTMVHVNSHFPELPPIAAFIDAFRKLKRKTDPHFINISCNSRTLYSILDIIGRCSGTPILDEITNSIGVDRRYQSFGFKLEGVPGIMNVQCWKSITDDSKDSPLGHFIQVNFPTGILSLNGTFGPTLWHPLAAGGVPEQFPLYSYLDAQNDINIRKLIKWRTHANKISIQRLSNAINALGELKDDCFWLHPTYLKSLSHQWQLIKTKLSLSPHPDTLIVPEIENIDETYWHPNNFSDR